MGGLFCFWLFFVGVFRGGFSGSYFGILQLSDAQQVRNGRCLLAVQGVYRRKRFMIP